MTENERQFVDEILARSSGCPDAEQLEAYDSNALDTEAHQRIETHVSACDACAAALRFLATEPEGQDTPESVRRRSEEWIAAARDERTVRRATLPRWTWVAAVAAVLAIVWLLPLGEQTDTPGGLEIRTTGGDTVESLVPEGPLPRSDCRLQWSAGSEGSTYRLTVFTEDLYSLATFENLQTAEYVVPESVLDQIEDDTFVWRVEIFSPDAEARISGTFASDLEGK